MEDVGLDNNYTTLIWYLLAVGKGYELMKKDLEWILGLISHLVDSKIKINYYENKLTQIDNLLLNQQFKTSDISDVLKSLLTRRDFGGMKCDINLIERVYNYHRINGIEQCCKIKPIEINIVNKFKPIDDILPYSVDFHCSSIINYLMKKYNSADWNSEDLKKSIWNNWSSINTFGRRL